MSVDYCIGVAPSGGRGWVRFLGAQLPTHTSDIDAIIEFFRRCGRAQRISIRIAEAQIELGHSILDGAVLETRQNRLLGLEQVFSHFGTSGPVNDTRLNAKDENVESPQNRPLNVDSVTDQRPKCGEVLTQSRHAEDIASRMSVRLTAMDPFRELLA